jgi:hypothetical protein
MLRIHRHSEVGKERTAMEGVFVTQERRGDNNPDTGRNNLLGDLSRADLSQMVARGEIEPPTRGFSVLVNLHPA